MTYQQLTTSLLCIALLSGCATLSKKECQQGDWYAIGLSDGENGYNASRIKDHSDACGEHQIRPDHAAYRRGRDQGLLSFCTARSGYHVGAKGSTYRNVCPQHLESDFLDGYRLGEAYHDLEQQKRKAEQHIAELEKRLSKGKKLPREERHVIHEEIKALSRDIGRIENELHAIQLDAEQL